MRTQEGQNTLSQYGSDEYSHWARTHHTLNPKPYATDDIRALRNSYPSSSANPFDASSSSSQAPQANPVGNLSSALLRPLSPLSGRLVQTYANSPKNDRSLTNFINSARQGTGFKDPQSYQAFLNLHPEQQSRTQLGEGQYSIDEVAAERQLAQRAKTLPFASGELSSEISTVPTEVLMRELFQRGQSQNQHLDSQFPGPSGSSHGYGSNPPSLPDNHPSYDFGLPLNPDYQSNTGLVGPFAQQQLVSNNAASIPTAQTSQHSTYSDLQAPPSSHLGNTPIPPLQRSNLSESLSALSLSTASNNVIGKASSPFVHYDPENHYYKNERGESANYTIRSHAAQIGNNTSNIKPSASQRQASTSSHSGSTSIQSTQRSGLNDIFPPLNLGTASNNVTGKVSSPFVHYDPENHYYTNERGESANYTIHRHAQIGNNTSDIKPSASQHQASTSSHSKRTPIPPQQSSLSDTLSALSLGTASSTATSKLSSQFFNYNPGIESFADEHGASSKSTAMSHTFRDKYTSRTRTEGKRLTDRKRRAKSSANQGKLWRTNNNTVKPAGHRWSTPEFLHD